MTDTNEDPAGKLTSFSDTLAGLERGKINDQLTSSLAVLIEEVNRLGKPGSLTLKLKVAPAGEPGRQIFISPEVALKTPDPDPFPSMFYVGNGGAHFREDPYDQRLPGFDATTRETPREIDTEQQPRTVGDEPGAGE